MRFVSSDKFEALRGRLKETEQASQAGTPVKADTAGGQSSWSGKHEALRLSNEWCLAVASSGVVDRVCVLGKK